MTLTTAVRAQVRAGPVINSDETGARVAGKNRWHWVFQTPGASYHEITSSRGGEVIDAFLDGAEPEVWGSDLWAPQVGTAAGAHQICLSHQFRDRRETGSGGALDLRRRGRRTGRAAVGVRPAPRLRPGDPAAPRAGEVSPATFARRRVLIEQATDWLVFGPPLAKREARQLQKRYQQHRASLYVFLERDAVEPTNNTSERDLRNAVIHSVSAACRSV